jgi:hypothetical protein
MRKFSFKIRRSNYLLLQEKQAHVSVLLLPELYILVESYLYPSSVLVAPLKDKSLPYEKEGESYTYNIYNLTVAFPSENDDELEEFETFMETLNVDRRPTLKRKRSQKLKECREALEEFIIPRVTDWWE